MRKILVVDDNPEIREIIRVLLSDDGYEIEEAKDGFEALEKVDATYDLVILDVMMPNMDGFKTCVKIRETNNVPILFLTAKDQDTNKTLGFSSGGDDYLVKPFSYHELTARVKALIRRYQVYKGKDSKEEVGEEIIIENMRIDTKHQNVFIDDNEISLTNIEYDILELLATNRKQVFDVVSLYEKIWKEDYYYSANNTVMVHIRNLRTKIEKDKNNPKIIVNVWGKGYRCE